MVPLHGLQVGLTWTWSVGLPPGPHPYLVTQVPKWASLGPCIWSLPGAHPELVTLVTTWESPGHGESGPHQGLTQSWCLCSPIGPDCSALLLGLIGTDDSDPNWASPRSADSGPHLWTIMT